MLGSAGSGTQTSLPMQGLSEMDTAVALVQAYLRLNGYFTVAEYPILEAHRAGAAQMATDIDILAFRFPRAVRQILGRGGPGRMRGLSIPDPVLQVPEAMPDMIIGEVKQGRARLNRSMRDPAILSAALARFGCCAPGDAEATARRLLRSGRAETPEGHAVRIVAFGSRGQGGGRVRVVQLSHVADFLRSYLREHWEVLRNAQFGDPVMGLLMTLEKAETAPGGAEET